MSPQVVGLLEDNLAATPEQLGDAARESGEELAQRHERVVAASLLALAALAGVPGTILPTGSCRTVGWPCRWFRAPSCRQVHVILCRHHAR